MCRFHELTSKIPIILLNNIAKILAQTGIPWCLYRIQLVAMCHASHIKIILLASQHSSLSHDLRTYLTRHTPGTVYLQAGELRGSDGVSRQDVAFHRQKFMNNFYMCQIKHLGRPRTSGFSGCDYRAAQMKLTVAFGSARTGNYLMVAIKKIATCSILRATGLSLDYCLYKWNTQKQMGALSRATVASMSLYEISTVQGYFLAISWTTHQKSVSVYAFKEVCDCEILISEIERRPVLYGSSLKEYSDKCLRDRLWEEVCEGKDGNDGHYNFQYQITSTVSNIPNKRTANYPNVPDALSNQSSDFFDICYIKL